MKQWPKITKTLDLKEKILFYFLLAIFIISALIGLDRLYIYKTLPVAKAGGEYIEGMVGNPARVNPALSASNDIDSDLSQIIFNGLMKYDGEGNLINDLTDSYEISDDKLTYTFHLKNNVFWHDGEKFTAEDVIFTTNTIANPVYKSPLRSNWQGIETEATDENTLVFRIQKPYAGFLHNLTFGILPKHIWEQIEPEKFALANLNLEPIGTGPFKFKKMQKDSSGNILSYELVANPNYFGGKPYISKLTFNFYKNEDEALDAYNRKEIMSFSGLTAQKMEGIKIPQSTEIHKFRLPRYYAVFINQTKSVPLADDKVREAFSYATNREEIIQNIFKGNAEPVYAPLFSWMPGYSEDLDKRDFNLEKAKKLLDETDWKMGDDGFRHKKNDTLEIIITVSDWNELEQTAEMLKTQWEKAGAKINVEKLSISEIQQNRIRPREYQALLYGQVLGGDPDLWSFWHSNEKKDPGMNLAFFGTSETDRLIEDGRMEFDLEKRAEKNREFQQKLNEEIPAIFLYSPNYIMVASKKVHIDDIKNLVLPSERFSSIDKWFVKTKRILKK